MLGLPAGVCVSRHAHQASVFIAGTWEAALATGENMCSEYAQFPRGKKGALSEEPFFPVLGMVILRFASQTKALPCSPPASSARPGANPRRWMPQPLRVWPSQRKWKSSNFQVSHVQLSAEDGLSCRALPSHKFESRKQYFFWTTLLLKVGQVPCMWESGLCQKPTYASST